MKTNVLVSDHYPFVVLRSRNAT